MEKPEITRFGKVIEDVKGEIRIIGFSVNFHNSQENISKEEVLIDLIIKRLEETKSEIINNRNKNKNYYDSHSGLSSDALRFFNMSYQERAALIEKNRRNSE